MVSLNHGTRGGIDYGNSPVNDVGDKNKSPAAERIGSSAEDIDYESFDAQHGRSVRARPRCTVRQQQ